VIPCKQLVTSLINVVDSFLAPGLKGQWTRIPAVWIRLFNVVNVICYDKVTHFTNIRYSVTDVGKMRNFVVTVTSFLCTFIFVCTFLFCTLLFFI